MAMLLGPPSPDGGALEWSLILARLSSLSFVLAWIFFQGEERRRRFDDACKNGMLFAFPPIFDFAFEAILGKHGLKHTETLFGFCVWQVQM